MSNNKDSKYELVPTADVTVVRSEGEQEKGTEDDVEQPQQHDKDLPKATLVSEGLHDEKPASKPQRYVEVTAPCDLPKGYRLPIKYQDEVEGRWVSGFAIIPEGGVYKFDKFKAQLAEPHPYMGGWAVGEFDCGSNRDNCFSVLSFFCKFVYIICISHIACPRYFHFGRAYLSLQVSYFVSFVFVQAFRWRGVASMMLRHIQEMDTVGKLCCLLCSFTG